MNTECVEAGTVGLESENLILKVQIIVSGDQGTVFMDELPVVGVDHQVAAAGGQNNPDGGDRSEGAAAAAALRNNNVVGNRLLDGHGRSGDQMRNLILAVQSGIHSLRRENVLEIKGAMASLSTTVEHGFSI